MIGLTGPTQQMARQNREPHCNHSFNPQKQAQSVQSRVGSYGSSSCTTEDLLTAQRRRPSSLAGETLADTAKTFPADCAQLAAAPLVIGGKLLPRRRGRASRSTGTLLGRPHWESAGGSARMGTVKAAPSEKSKLLRLPRTAEPELKLWSGTSAVVLEPSPVSSDVWETDRHGWAMSAGSTERAFTLVSWMLTMSEGQAVPEVQWVQCEHARSHSLIPSVW